MKEIQFQKPKPLGIEEGTQVTSERLFHSFSLLASKLDKTPNAAGTMSWPECQSKGCALLFLFLVIGLQV